MTLAQMYKRIYATIGSDTSRKRQYVADSDTLEFINAGLRLMCLVGKCYVKKEDLSILEDTADYVLTATDVIEVFSVIDGDGQALTRLEPDKAGKVFSVVGEPMWWWYLGRVLTVSPTPTKEATFKIMYHALDTDLAASTDSPNIEEHYHGAIVDFTLASMYLRLGVLSLAQMYAQNFSMISGIALGVVNDKLGIKQPSPQGA
jgi:hypothetical protein